MREGNWDNAELTKLLALTVEGQTPEQIGQELGRSTQAVRTKGWRIGLSAMTREELREPTVAIRICLNEDSPHPFVSTHKGNRICLHHLQFRRGVAA